MLRNINNKNIVVGLLIVSLALFLMFGCSRNQQSTDQSTPSPSSTGSGTLNNNPKQSNPERLIDCLNEYKLFIENNNINDNKCPYNNNGIPNFAQWQTEYDEYVNNVLKAEELKSQSATTIKSIINDYYTKNENHLNFIQTNITQFKNSPPNANLPQKLEERLEAIKNSLQLIKAIDEFSKNVAVISPQKASKPITQADLWPIIAYITLISMIVVAIVFVVQRRDKIKDIGRQLKRLRDEMNASKKKSHETDLAGFKVDRNITFFSQRFDSLDADLKEIKDSVRQENSSHTDRTNENEITSRVATIISDALRSLIEETNNTQIEEIIRRLGLQTENENLKKVNKELNDEIKTVKIHLRNLENEHNNLIQERRRDKERIERQENQISNLNSQINRLKDNIEPEWPELSSRNYEKTTPSLYSSKEHEDQHQAPATVALPQNIADLVARYNSDPNLLWQHVTKVMTEVSEPVESFEERRDDNSQPIIFKSLSSDTNKSDYCVITVTTEKGDTYLLFPKINTINYAKYKVICGKNSLFECSGYREGITKKFYMIEPATVSPRDTSRKEWQLKERGKLKFIEE